MNNASILPFAAMLASGAVTLGLVTTLVETHATSPTALAAVVSAEPAAPAAPVVEDAAGDPSVPDAGTAMRDQPDDVMEAPPTF
jgi:hypothetical protein